MGKYEGFMERKRHPKKKPGRTLKETDNDNRSYEFSGRMDSAEEQTKTVKKNTQPVHERTSQLDNIRPEMQKEQHERTSESENIRPELHKRQDYTYYFSFVLDATADVALVYDRIYAMLIRVVDKLEATRNHRSSERREISMKIGITTFHDEVSGPEEDKFGRQYFTDDFDAVRERLRNMEFWGGNCNDGRECVNEAQLEGLRRMALQRDNDDELGASCSQILITTSLPPATPGNETGYVSFAKGDGDLKNRLDLGVRFALNIVLDKDQYDPNFKIVDRDGKVSQEKSGYIMMENIEDILNGIVKGQNQGRLFDDKADAVAKIVNDLLEQTSLLSIMN